MINRTLFGGWLNYTVWPFNHHWPGFSTGAVWLWVCGIFTLCVSLFPCTSFLTRVVECTQRYLRRTRWSALAVGTVGTTTGTRLCICTGCWESVRDSSSCPLPQRTFSTVYIGYSSHSMRLLPIFWPCFMVFTFLGLRVLSYMGNVKDIVSHWDVIKRFDVCEIFTVILCIQTLSFLTCSFPLCVRNESVCECEGTNPVYKVMCFRSNIAEIFLLEYSVPFFLILKNLW